MKNYIGHADLNSTTATETRTGILLVNLGTPSAPTAKAVRKYLAEFLSDPRVVEIPKLLWQPILYGLVLPFRAHKSAEAYKKIWTADGSPLLAITKKQTQALQNKLQNEEYIIEYAMRYGEPSITTTLAKFHQLKINRLLIIPLYPQYSSATTGSVFDAIVKTLKKWRWIPELHMINHYATDENYINAIATSIQQYWQEKSRGEKLLFSFHGLPQRSIKQGDPYFYQCEKTTRLIVEKLQLKTNEWELVFQSRFGKETWLQPYCDESLIKLAQAGYKNLDIVCPGFATDCLETLEEISLRNAEIFIKAGGKKLNYIPALNDSFLHIQMLTTLIKKYLHY